jgi:membrane protein implicated in regulation of membrane protease activity
MYLTIPTWLIFLSLGIASFAPVASLWPGWRMAYYGALLMCWVLISVAAMRRMAREERQAKQSRATMLHQLRLAKETEAAARADGA